VPDISNVDARTWCALALIAAVVRHNDRANIVRPPSRRPRCVAVLEASNIDAPLLALIAAGSLATSHDGLDRAALALIAAVVGT
jgi:hypothetical protein